MRNDVSTQTGESLEANGAWGEPVEATRDGEPTSGLGNWGREAVGEEWTATRAPHDAKGGLMQE